MAIPTGYLFDERTFVKGKNRVNKRMKKAKYERVVEVHVDKVCKSQTSIEST